MGELNDIEDLPDIAPASISPADGSSDMMEEVVLESDANNRDNEMQEFPDFDCEGLSLTRWASHPPTEIPPLHSKRPKPQLRVDDVVPKSRSPLSPLALHSFSEREGDDAKQSMFQSSNVTDMCEELRRSDASRSLVATAPRIESSTFQIEIKVLEFESNQ